MKPEHIYQIYYRERNKVVFFFTDENKLQTSLK